MIWIIASIPFWALSIILGALATIGIMAAVLSPHCKGDDFVNAVFGGAVILIGSGVLAVIAAKIAS